MAALTDIVRYKPLQFAAIGLLCYLWLAPGAADRGLIEPVVLDAQRLQSLSDGWLASMGRPPGPQELDGLRRRELDDEILFREALERSLHRLDPVVKQRLLLNMRFLDPAGTADDETLFAEALRLQMHMNDVVVRRRLVQIMEMSIQDGADRSAASGAELEAMYAERREELALPARWRITQVYFSADRRGQRVLADAQAALERLRAGATPPADAVALGDPFLGGHQLPLLNAVQLAGQFGEDFAGAVVDCLAQQWCGPVSSSYGRHLVWVDEVQAGRLPPADDPAVHKRLEADVLRARAQRALAEAMVALRRKYGVAA